MGGEIGGSHGLHYAHVGHHVIQDAQQEQGHDGHQDRKQQDGLPALVSFMVHCHLAFQVSEREMNHSLFQPSALSPSSPLNRVGA